MKTAKEFLEDKNIPEKRDRQIIEGWLEEYAKEILTDYTDFLLKHGYCDTDVYCEPPTAIDRFMHPKLNK